MFIIGELINGMYKKVGEAISKKDKSVIQELAKQQTQAGACALDLNCGPLSKDPVNDMIWLVETAQGVTDAILCLDSTKIEAIGAGLEKCKNKRMINSTSADRERLEKYLPLAKKHDALLIALAMSKKGVPQDKNQRLEFAAEIVTVAQECDFNLENLYLDPVVLPVNVAQASGQGVLDALKEFKLLSTPAPKTVIGLSNASQGSKNRNLINRIYLTMCIASGLDAAILDPLDNELMDSLISAELILNKHIYCDSFLDAYRKK